MYKNEMQDEISDEELLHFMKEQFETVCFGDLDYLTGTCLPFFLRQSGQVTGAIAHRRGAGNMGRLTK